MKFLKTFAAAAVVLAAALSLAAQTQESQSMKLLRLKSAQLSLELRKADFDRYLKLKEDGLTSESDYAQRQTAYLQAQVDYQQALISFMGSEARISVASAVKYQDRSGKKFVRVALRYASKELKELAKLNISAEDLFPLDFMKEIKDVSVSLRSEGKIISDPYERTIPRLPLEGNLDLTYRCNNACAHCYNARARSYPELKTEDWIEIIDKLWEIKIPHIVFTGGEPTLREDLPELIRHAENNGQITGLNTNGRKLADQAFVQQLLDSGLDHVQITLESHLPEIHDQMVCHKGAWQETIAGIRNVLDTRLYVMTNTTMLTHNRSSIPETLQFLADLGVPTVGLNALIYSGRGKSVGTGLSEEELQPLLASAQTLTSRNGQRLIWYTPTQYCNFDPVQFGLGVKGCTAALYNMCLEPDGAVLPCQSYYHPVGNIRTNTWEEIWNHDLCLELRERKNLPAKCSDCLIQTECGGGCPLRFDDYAEDDSWRS